MVMLSLIPFFPNRLKLPSSVLSGDKDRDVDGRSGLISFCDRSRGESAASLMSQRSLDRVTAKTAGPVVFVPLVAESSAVAFVVLKGK